MKLRSVLIMILVATAFNSCVNGKVLTEAAQLIEQSYLSIDLDKESVKTVKVIIHAFNDNQGKGNFQDTDKDRKWLEQQIRDANYLLAHVAPPIPKDGRYYADSKIRIKLLEIMYWSDSVAFDTKVGGDYDYRDLFRDYVLENDKLSKEQRENVVHILLSGTHPRAYGGRNICMTRSCDDGFGFQNNTLYFEGMYQVYTGELIYYGVGAHIVHELGHGLGLGHYNTGYGRCGLCQHTRPCPMDSSNNFMLSNNGGWGITECQMKMMHHLLKYGPIDSNMINLNSGAHKLIEGYFGR